MSGQVNGGREWREGQLELMHHIRKNLPAVLRDDEHHFAAPRKLDSRSVVRTEVGSGQWAVGSGQCEAGTRKLQDAVFVGLNLRAIDFISGFPILKKHNTK